KKNQKDQNEGYPHQSLRTDKKNLVAHIDTYHGFNSWSSVWDFSAGFVATRLFSKKTCVISKINRDTLPFIVLAPSPLSGELAQPSPAPEYNYVVSRRRVTNLAPYGKPIQALCRGVPTYLALPATRQHCSITHRYYQLTCYCRSDFLLNPQQADWQDSGLFTF
uniref:Gastrokine 1 n=1 Tax=Nothoprocta perdicaria TaxID=30464 RepID=A0A8C6ZHM0_NOTPE